MITVGIECSCDDTSIGLVDDTHRILALKTVGQQDMHKIYGGVVPELASRLHLNAIQKTFETIINKSNINISDIDAICATAGPGLIGGLIVGTMFAKGLAISLNKPFYPINHLEAHILTARLTNPELKFPYLSLLVSGGNTQIVLVNDVADYKIIGKTIDDACGECFDKIAKVLNLPYPNGIEIEKYAKQYSREKCGEMIKFSKPKVDGANFSFSGLKSNVVRYIQQILDNKNNITDNTKYNICYSLNKNICEIINDKLDFALQDTIIQHAKIKSIVVAGGVAANFMIREKLNDIAKKYNLDFIAPPLNLCGDNGAMIAWTGIEHIQKKEKPDINFSPRPRWSLNEIRI